MKSWHADLRGMPALLVSLALLTLACDRQLEAFGVVDDRREDYEVRVREGWRY